MEYCKCEKIKSIHTDTDEWDNGMCVMFVIKL